MGGIQYEILAVDRTKEGTDSAKKGIDDIGVHYSDALSNIAFNFNMITQAAQTAYGIMQSGWNETIGVAEAYQDQMDDMHNMFGISIEDAQKWRAATVATDTDMGSLTITMRYLTQRVTDQSEAGEKLRATLSGIGVEAKDVNGKWKDGSELLQEVLVALKDIPEGAERAGVASQILGRNWYRMADMIENADTAVKTFESTHASMTEAESEKIEKFKIKWAQLADKIELAKADVGLFFIELDEQGSKMEGKSYLDQWLENTFKKTGEATSGAGGRSGDGGITPDAPKNAEIKKNFQDQYTGLTDIQIQIKETTAEYEKYIAAMKTDTTQEQFDKDAAAAQKAKNHLDTLNESLNNQKETIDALTRAYSSYESELEKVNNAKKSLYDLDLDTATQLQNVGTDIAAARRIIQSSESQRRRLKGNLENEESTLATEATEFNQIKAGVPLEQIKGTEQYEKKQATTIGQITIENINLSKDYTANDFMNDLTAGRIAKGVPIQQ